jgi:pimeloyl-ACP methyl ester carboxylesterase
MKFYTFGNESKPAILLLPGTCCHWKRSFQTVIPLLEQDFYVVCVSYDGFDESEKTIFPDMITETEKMEAYILERFGGRIHAAYGCSMGGSFAGLLLQRKNVHIDHVILGSSDLDQSGRLAAKLKSRIIAPILYNMFQSGKLPHWMQRRLDKKSPEDKAYTEKMLEMFGVGGKDMAFVQSSSIFNQFYSDLITPLENQIDVEGTTVHIFYALKMGPQYEERYCRHFKRPDIIRHDLQHEELLVCSPARWAQEVKKCLK